MDRDRDRDRGGRQVKRPKTSSSSNSGDTRQHSSSSSSREREAKEEKVAPAHDEEKIPAYNKKDVFEKVSSFEYEEAKTLDIGKGHHVYNSILSTLEENVVEIFTLKHGSGGAADDERKGQLKLEGINCMISLRTLNRLLKFKLKIAKDAQALNRQHVDSEHLVLQNLLYEATNLQNQVAAVQDYKGMDEKIDLIPVEQFYNEAPESVSKPELTRSDPHRLRIARLEYEFIQRQKLTEQCNGLEKEKEAIAKSIEDKQVKLDSVRPLLNKVLESTLPLQDFFGLDISARRCRNESARFLPPPLYVLFVQSEAYQEFTDGKNHLALSIGGDVEAAKELLVAQDEEEEDSDSERVNHEADSEVSERRILRKRTSIGNTLDDNRKRTFQKHPLWIEWIVKSKGNESVTIQFHYIIKLKIVTVKSRVRRDTADGTSSTSISGNSDNVLNELYLNDSGVESPNPANSFILNKFGIQSLNNYLKEMGKPYLWAQKICGLEFPEPGTGGQDFEPQVKMSLSCKSIEGTLKQIRKRLTNQSKLWSQLKALESRNIQIPPAAKELLPEKNSTTFSSWESIDFEIFCRHSFTQPLVSCEGVTAKDMFFKATLQRGRAKMIALVAIKMDFPVMAPVFCVQLDMDGELRDATTNSIIRDLEKEINYYAPIEFDEWSDNLVSLQLHRLMACCDIILETDMVLRESELEGPSEFRREKLILKSTVGRNLRRPFKYVNQGGGYFTQRY